MQLLFDFDFDFLIALYNMKYYVIIKNSKRYNVCSIGVLVEIFIENIINLNAEINDELNVTEMN